MTSSTDVASFQKQNGGVAFQIDHSFGRGCRMDFLRRRASADEGPDAGRQAGVDLLALAVGQRREERDALQRGIRAC